MVRKEKCGFSISTPCPCTLDNWGKKEKKNLLPHHLALCDSPANLPAVLCQGRHTLTHLTLQPPGGGGGQEGEGGRVDGGSGLLHFSI